MATGGSNAYRANTSTPANTGTGTGNNIVPALPLTTKVKAAAESFFRNSGHTDSILNQVSVLANGTTSFPLINTGLVDKLVIAFSGSIPFKNTAGAAQAFSLSPIFPLDTVSNVNVSYQGQLSIVSASPYEIFGLLAKRGKGIFLQQSAGGLYSQLKARISQKKLWVNAGNGNITLTAGDGLSGYSGFSVAAGTTGILNYGFVLEIPMTFRRDIPIGLVALQNNTINVQVQITAPAWLGTSALSPVFISGSIPGTASIDSAGTTYLNATPVQYYWETPNDKSLYQYFVANSYIYVSLANQKIPNTGSRAFQAILPNNYILTAALFTLRDSSANLIDCYNNITNLALNYNNTTFVDQMPQAVREYLQECYYESTVTGPGQLLWDATIHEYEANNLSDSSFLDMFKANNPQFFADVGSTVGVPGTYSIAKEMIVPALVNAG